MTSESTDRRVANLFNTRRDTLLEIADALGHDTLSLLPLAQAKLSSYSQREIIDYLESVWPAVERERQRLSYRYQNLVNIYLITLSIFGCALILFAIYTGEWRSHTPLFLGLSVWYLLYVVPFTQWMMQAKKEYHRGVIRSQGLTLLLVPNSDSQHVGFLIEALNAHGEIHENDAVKTRLTRLLPLHTGADVPPLTDYQTRILMREVRSGLSLRCKQVVSPSMQIEVAFLAAVLHYFAHEAAVGRSIPAPLLRLIPHFCSPLSIPLIARRWQSVQDAAEACLRQIPTHDRR